MTTVGVLNNDPLSEANKYYGEPEVEELPRVLKMCDRLCSISFLVIGIISIVLAGVGFAAFGGHQGWWSIGGLTNLSQFGSIAMMLAPVLGGIEFLIYGTIGLITDKSVYLW